MPSATASSASPWPPVASPEGIVAGDRPGAGADLLSPAIAARAEQLLDYLRAKELLLVLDNCEHLLAEHMAQGCLVAELLSAAPDVRILATSRARLSLHGEQVLLGRGHGLSDLSSPPHPLSSPDGRGEGARGMR